MKMKTCQTVQGLFQSIGITANGVSFGFSELIHTFAYILGIMSLIVYLIHVAETAKECAQPISLIPVDTLILTTYLTLKFNSRIIFKIFDDIEQIVNKSE